MRAKQYRTEEISCRLLTAQASAVPILQFISNGMLRLSYNGLVSSLIRMVLERGRIR
jgi:hypothetical protein